MICNAGKASITDNVFCLWLSLRGGNHILILLQPKTVIFLLRYAIFLSCIRVQQWDLTMASLEVSFRVDKLGLLMWKKTPTL